MGYNVNDVQSNTIKDIEPWNNEHILICFEF